MTFSPKKQLSKVNGRKRHSAWIKLNAKRLKDTVSLQYDADGNAIGLSHFASPITGEYKGRKIVRIKSGRGANPTKIRA